MQRSMCKTTHAYDCACRMQVIVDQPSVAQTTSILRGLRERYELHHGVRISDNALVEAANLADRCAQHTAVPRRAIDRCVCAYEE
jgi:ATP-dependent Clp protease ATP-binding subunit ClpA